MNGAISPNYEIDIAGSQVFTAQVTTVANTATNASAREISLAHACLMTMLCEPLTNSLSGNPWITPMT